MWTGQRMRRRIEAITHSTAYTIMVVVLSIFIVFAADLTIAFLPYGTPQRIPLLFSSDALPTL